MEVWYSILLLFTITTWILAILYKYETNSPTITRYSEAALTVIGTLCQQGTETRMENASTRIAFVHIMLFNVLLYNYYGACIVSARLNGSITKMNDSLSQLAKSGLKVASEWMPYFGLFIKKPDWETRTFYTSVWQKLPESQQFIEPEKGLELVKKGGFAYHMHPDVGYPFINRHFDNREICELMEVHLATPTYAAFGVGRNCTFTEMMRVGLTKMVEVGIRQRQVHRWTTSKPECDEDNLSASSIDIFEFGPHLVLLIFGISFALSIFLVEITGIIPGFSRRRSHNRKKVRFYGKRKVTDSGMPVLRYQNFMRIHSELTVHR